MNTYKVANQIIDIIGIVMAIGLIMRISFEKMLILFLLIISIKILTNTSRIKKLEKEMDVLKNKLNQDNNYHEK